MKNIFKSLTFILALLSVALSFTPVERHGKLSFQNGQLVNQYGQPPYLKGMSMFWSNWSGDFWNEELIDWLCKDWKIEIVRAAMGIAKPDDYLSNPEREKNKVITVVEAAIKNGIYVIIDWHIEGDNSPYLNQEKAFFDEMSKKYGDNDHVLYELWNEPTQQDWNSVIKPFHEQVLQVIRQNTKNLVILGTDTWSQGVDAACDNQVNDANIAYTLHFYVGSHKEDIRNKLRYAVGKNCPIFVTEYGYWSKPIDTYERDQWLNLVNEHKISHAMWAVYDNTDEPSATIQRGGSRTGGWKSSDLTELGNFMRSYIRGDSPPDPNPPTPGQKGCCAWYGHCKDVNSRDWCDESQANCTNCTGTWIPN